MLSRNSLRFTKFKMAVMICLIGIFFTGSALRYGVYGNNILGQHSLLTYLGICLVYIYDKGGRLDLSSVKYDKKQMLLSLLILIVVFFIIAMTSGIFIKLHIYISIVVPLLIISFRFRDSKFLYDVIKCWKGFLKISVIIMLITEIIDVLSGYSVTAWIANFTNVASFSRILKQQRCVTYMGHPLFSSELFLAYYLFSHLIARIENKKDSLWDFLFPLVGILMTQSRTGLILILMAFLVFNLEWKYVQRIFTAFVILILLYQFGLFDSVLERFEQSILAGDITAGRNSSFVTLFTTGQFKLYWFQGQSIDYDGSVTLLSMALEYPIACWAYNLGIIISMLLTIGYFVYPLIAVVKRRQKDVFWALLLLVLDVCTYSGLGNNDDKPLLFCIMCCLIMNISNYLYKRDKNELELLQ